jgi:hypothetical protein
MKAQSERGPGRKAGAFAFDNSLQAVGPICGGLLHFLMRTAWAVVAGGVVACSAFAAPPKVLVSNLNGTPTRFVPGLPGVAFVPGIGAGSTFQRVVCSPDGSRWAVQAWALVSTGVEAEVVCTGSGTSNAGGFLVARLGNPSFFDAARTYTDLDLSIGVNNAGQVAFAGGVSGVSTNNAFAARFTPPSTYALIAREGTQAVGQPAGIGYGAINDGVCMTESGAVILRSAVLTGAQTQHVVYSLSSLTSGTVIAQTDAHSPAGQLASPPQTLDFLATQRLAASADGSVVAWAGDLNGNMATDAVIVVGGSVVAQEGFVLPGLSLPVQTVCPEMFSLAVAPFGGSWAATGSNIDTGDWVLVNGSVAAGTDWPIAQGYVERFDDTSLAASFHGVAVNSVGNYLIAGMTDGPANANEVLVLDGRRVVLREGDPIDINGNGVADDNAFAGSLREAGIAMADNRRVFAIIGVRNSSGGEVGSAIVTFTAGCNSIDFNRDGLFPDNADIEDFFNVFGGGSCSTGACDTIDFNNDDLLPDQADLEDFLRVFSGGPC